MSTRLLSIAIATAVFVIAAPSAGRAQSTTTCAGPAVKVGETWVLDCGGSCPEAPMGMSNDCRGVPKTDAIGDYSVCDCTRTGGAEGTCCHTVLRNGMPTGKGTCNPNPPASCTGGTKCDDADSSEDGADYLCK